MNWKEYSSLKSGSKVSFAKPIFLTIDKKEYSLSDLEREKARYDADIARAKEQSDGLALAITDFKKV